MQTNRLIEQRLIFRRCIFKTVTPNSSVQNLTRSQRYTEHCKPVVYQLYLLQEEKLAGYSSNPHIHVSWKTANIDKYRFSRGSPHMLKINSLKHSSHLDCLGWRQWHCSICPCTSAGPSSHHTQSEEAPLQCTIGWRGQCTLSQSFPHFPPPACLGHSTLPEPHYSTTCHSSECDLNACRDTKTTCTVNEQWITWAQATNIIISSQGARTHARTHTHNTRAGTKQYPLSWKISLETAPHTED